MSAGKKIPVGDLKLFYEVLKRAADLGVISQAERGAYVLTGTRHRTIKAVTNELQARIEAYFAVDKLEPTNPHTGSPRGGQDFI